MFFSWQILPLLALYQYFVSVICQDLVKNLEARILKVCFKLLRHLVFFNYEDIILNYFGSNTHNHKLIVIHGVELMLKSLPSIIIKCKKELGRKLKSFDALFCCCSVPKSCPTLLLPHGLQPTRLLCPWDFLGNFMLGPTVK